MSRSHRKQGGTRDNKRPRRLETFLKTSILGILVFAVLQAVFGNLLSDWAKGFFAHPELRFRYFILDIEGPSLAGDKAYPLQGDTLQKLFDGQPVYIQRNGILQVIDYLTNNLLAGQVGERNYPSTSDYTTQLLPSEDIKKLYSGDDGDMFSVIPKNSQLLARGVLQNKAARELARANPELSGTFYCVLNDVRHQCDTVNIANPYYIETIYPTRFKILALDIENLSDAPANVTTLKMHKRRDDPQSLKLYSTLGPEAGEMEIEEEASFPVGALMKGEHLLVPLSVMAEKANHDTWASSAPSGLSRDLIRSVEFNTQNSEARQQALYYRPRLQEVQSDFYYLGPAYRVDSVRIGSKDVSVRSFDFDNLTYATLSGGGVGSCPTLYIKDESTRSWTPKENILVGAVGRHESRRETLLLSDFSGEIEIRENEDEMTFLDYLAIKVRTNGAEKTCTPKEPKLLKADNNFLILKKGDHILLQCDTDGRGEARLIVEGYYTASNNALDRAGPPQLMGK